MEGGPAAWTYMPNIDLQAEQLGDEYVQDMLA
jgi:hypothetical protein